MVKSGLVIAAWVTIASACAFVDSPETEVKTAEVSAPQALFDSAPTVSEVDTPTGTQAPVPRPRSLTPDDIRRMQVRLREVGLDGGPIDGVAGAKTKAAFKRFQSGCAQVQGLLDESHSSALLGAPLNKGPGRPATLAMQTQLRAAGFNPGPADGVFGSRLKTVLGHLQNGCPTTAEFAGALDHTVGAADKIALAAHLPQRPSATQIIPAQSRLEAAKQLALPPPVRPQEEVRILQLRLRDAGYDPGPFDGVMGPKTKLAMQQMQSSQRSGKTKTALSAGIGVQY